MAKAARRSRTRGRPASKSSSRSTSRSTSRSRGRSNKKKRRSKKVGGAAAKMVFEAATHSGANISDNIFYSIETFIQQNEGITFFNILKYSLFNIKNMLDCTYLFDKVEPKNMYYAELENPKIARGPPNKITITTNNGFTGKLEILEDTGNKKIIINASLTLQGKTEEQTFESIPITTDEETYENLINFVVNNVKNNKPLTDTGITKAVLPTGETLTNPENYIEYTVTPDGETEYEYKNKLFINKDCNSTKDQNTPLIAYSINGEDKLYKIQNLEILKEQEKMSKMTDKQIADYIEKNPQGASNANNDL